MFPAFKLPARQMLREGVHMVEVARRGCLLACQCFSGSVLRAAQPLEGQVDAMSLAKAGSFKPAEVVDDAGFLRRIYLDLAGRIPTAEEARAFLSDNAADKRAKLIDQLLASPDYPRRMQQLFQVMLMERRADDPQ